jgi:Protein of unknown function (DUF2950)
MKTKIVLVCVMFLSISAALCFASDQKTFATPDEAVKALMAAVESNNQDELLAVFGPDAKDLVSSGDDVQDRNSRAAFVKSYKAKHAIIAEDPNTRVLQVGAKDWELPIPIVLADGRWHFDTAAGKQELKGDPYHGYYYRGLKAQGAAAPGGAKSYLVDGVLKGGAALIAYPAQYKVSGVMTFIIDQDGVVYQKDLGESTTEAAKAITEYNPDSSWTKVAD